MQIKFKKKMSNSHWANTEHSKDITAVNLPYNLYIPYQFLDFLNINTFL
jgi:hypothetical protein